MRRRAVPGYALVLALLTTAPLLAPGYLLLRDAVSTPRSYLSDAALGLTDAAPRAVPQDFAIALASHVLDGGVVVKALLVAGLWLAGWGSARLAAELLPGSGMPGQFVAATVAIWNPYVAERLLQGHWSLLVGYGCLPWVAHSVVRLRADGLGRSGFFGLALWTALAGLTPTGLMMAATVALVCVAAPGAGRPRWLCATTALGVALLCALPWLTASMLTNSLSAYQASGAPGFAAFAARADPGLGTLGTLAGLGGIWNADAVPGSRSTIFALVATTILLGVVVTGIPAVASHRSALPLLVLAATAVTAPALMATGPGMAVLHAVVETVPGLGVLRDAQKWVALAVPGYTVAAAGSVVTLRKWRAASVGTVACIAILVALPDLAWGAWGKVSAVRYPPGWAAVAAAINADPRPVFVLPADSMRQFSWAGSAPVLDPLPRWVRANVLTTGDLSVSGHTVPGEGDRARRVQQLLLGGASADRVADDGIGWVVAQLGSRGEMGDAAKTLAALPVVYRDGEIALYRVDGQAPGAPWSHRRAAVATHALWLAVLAVGTLGSAGTTIRSWPLTRRRRRSF
jgi:hypothetical protein